jgi:hypothetical protein
VRHAPIREAREASAVVLSILRAHDWRALIRTTSDGMVTGCDVAGLVSLLWSLRLAVSVAAHRVEVLPVSTSPRTRQRLERELDRHATRLAHIEHMSALALDRQRGRG